MWGGRYHNNVFNIILYKYVIRFNLVCSELLDVCTCDIIPLESFSRHYRAEITMGYFLDLIIMLPLLLFKKNSCSQPESICVRLSVMYVCPSQAIPPMTLLQGHSGSTKTEKSALLVLGN